MNRTVIIALALVGVVGAGLFFARKKPATSADSPPLILDPLAFSLAGSDPDNPASLLDTSVSVGSSASLVPDAPLIERVVSPVGDGLQFR